MSGKYPIKKYDKEGNEIYYENSYGFWYKYDYDNNGNRIYFENSYGFWYKYDYDEKGNIIYYEDSNGNWRNGFQNKITNNREGIIIRS